MTINEAYQGALAILAERADDSELACFAVGWCNLLMGEALAAENSIRRAAGGQELVCAPVLTSMQDALPCAEIIAQRAFPCGLAAFLYEAADDSERALDYRARWINALADCSRAVPGDVTDCY